MSSAATDPRQLSPALAARLADETGACTGCGICVTECGFLKLYGVPRDIARSYDPEDPKKNVVCFECSLCGLCTAVCPEGLDPQALFLEMRREAVVRGYGTFPEHRGLLGYERTGMSRRFSWYGLPQGCTTIFFPGCALPGTRPTATMAVYGQLQADMPALGLVLDCCAKPSHDLGRQSYFEEMFGEMVAWLESQGVQRVLVACPNCYKVFSEYAPQLRTETVYEKLAEILPGRVALLSSESVTVHDPCVVRFASAPQAAARALIASTGRLLAEMPHTGITALCCGEGGTVAALAPELAESWGARRAAEAGGRQVVTYCAGCANHLGKRLKVSHLLDLIFDTPKPSSGPMTYINRLRLKSRFKKIIKAAATRERVTDLNLPRTEEPWNLRMSLQRKAICCATLVVIFAAAVALIQKFFWALNAHLYTIEFNLLFVAHRLKDADLAGFVEYLRPMSGARAAGVALLSQVMQAFAFPFSPLRIVDAFATAFGALPGALYTGGAALASAGLAALCGRFLLGDLRPLYNLRRGVAPLTPPAAWAGLGVAGMAAIPAVPLVLCGLWIGLFRLSLLRCAAAITGGLTVRILISIAVQ